MARPSTCPFLAFRRRSTAPGSGGRPSPILTLVYGVLGVHPWLMGLMEDRAVHDVWGDDDTTRLCSSLMPPNAAVLLQPQARAWPTHC